MEIQRKAVEEKGKAVTANETQEVKRRAVIGWSAALAAGCILRPAVMLAETAGASEDWSQRLVDSTLKRNPEARNFNHGWNYSAGLFLFGQYLVYRRTREPRLLEYMKSYVDAHVNEHGQPDEPIESLDCVLTANLLIVLYEETKDQRYKLGAEIFRRRFDTYPRTSDGGFWHGNRPERAWQLWLDGVYMALQFLLRYGRTFGDSAYANAEAVRQLLVYHKHLKAERSGLLYHAYDESGKAAWADPVQHRSRDIWCRSVGWYGMMLVDTLDVIPQNQPGRGELLTILRELVEGIANCQDLETGLWYEVLDRPKLAGNWTETSSSSMFTYMISIAQKRGYIAAKYAATARKGYRGVMSRVSIGSDGLTNIAEICVGTNAGDTAWYLARPRQTNDPHGLGAFLLMNEEWNHSVSSMRFRSGM
jgi:unsaturated rhamnogalacturonyl hydrolase